MNQDEGNRGNEHGDGDSERLDVGGCPGRLVDVSSRDVLLKEREGNRVSSRSEALGRGREGREGLTPNWENAF